MESTSNMEFPDFHLDASKNPFVKNWETGKTYQIMLTVKQISKHESQGMSDAGFKIISAKECADEMGKPKTMKEHNEYMATERKKANA